jgi:hypothetical protein
MNITRASTTAFLLLAAAIPLQPARAATSSSAALGARYHVAHSSFPSYPYGGDFSYAAAYQWQEDAGYWQLALDYAPKVTGTNGLDAVWTPQLNLIFTDRMWRGGGGVLTSYGTGGGKKPRWSPFYWQVMAGLNLPVQSFTLDLMVFYVFENPKTFKNFDFNDLEFGVWLNFPL